MSSERWVSIIVCTCNRAAALRNTLEVLGTLQFPPEWAPELLVVDNGSGDDTARIVENTALSNMQVRFLFEPGKGLSRARNAGLTAARGELILFTDDDVTPAPDWAMEMMLPLLNGTCDAVIGKITLDPKLTRDWLTSAHRWWLASSDDARPHEGFRELIGASMGFRRPVLERVPAFDTELGAGALGFSDDTLFGWQLAEAGFRIGYAPAARVIHHLNASRLGRTEWLDASRNRGRSEAYLRYHWEHSDICNPRLRELQYLIKLQLRRMLQRPIPLESEGCPLWEMSYVLNIEMCRQFRLERRRPRNYLRRGLAKLATSGNPVDEIASPGKKAHKQTVDYPPRRVDSGL
jgi:glucosyl-dolichyl phosphate glucuronosyltransferase